MSENAKGGENDNINTKLIYEYKYYQKKMASSIHINTEIFNFLKERRNKRQIAMESRKKEMQ